MSRYLLAAVLVSFVAGFALADSGPTVSPSTSAVTATVSADGGRLTWYVDTRGSNANTCTSPYADGGRVGPCLTTQGSLAKIPKLLRHQVAVQHEALADGGAANYPCFFVTGFTQDLGYTIDGGLLFTGPLVNAYQDGGALSGTGTIGAVGTDGTVRNWSTVTDGTQLWGADVLQGFLIEITGGTGLGSVVQIVGNDAGTLTTVGTWGQNAQVTPTAGSTYAIRQPGWVVSTACAAPGAPLAAPVANQAGIFVVGNQLDIVSGDVAFMNVGFNYASGAGLIVGGNTAVRMRNYRQILPNGAGVSTLLNSIPRINLDRGSFTGTAATYAVSPLGASAVTVTGSIAYGANAGLVFSPNGAAGLSAFVVNNSRSKNSTQGGLALFNCAPPANVQQSWFDCADSTGVGVLVGVRTAALLNTVSGSSFGPGMCATSLINVTVGPTCGVGVGVAGPLVMVTSNGMSGAQAITGYEANWGGRVQHLPATTNLTGAVQDVSLDHGAVVAAFADVPVASCQVADGGLSKYDSRFCK